MERQVAQFLQTHTELIATIQAFQEYKELTKSKLCFRGLRIVTYVPGNICQSWNQKRGTWISSNKHLENILKAAKAHKKQEILTTPTKPYNLRTRLLPLSSPNYLNGNRRGDEDVNDIQTEQRPPEMTEMACEALTEELQQVQEQASQVQTQLDQQELKSRKLLQQFAKLEEQLLYTERRGWNS
ncbi:hypothetical protein J4Q44_G00224490 [Coregonus suidteri]|uniref:Uncharacterized protein n=1 Tax=Coregonus suidteri TaxID=861788 RepID=A0AAN8LP07_9TELE